MNEFPAFMRHPANKIAAQTQYTQGVEGYVFDGADMSQMAFWTYYVDATSVEHTHEYEEYFVVVQGEYILTIAGKQIPVRVGEEYLIPKGIPHSGEAKTGTRTIHAFGGKRAKRSTEYF
jgi:mannose-6-phosphate isomerase-like protein (cupin superfamily)